MSLQAPKSRIPGPAGAIYEAQQQGSVSNLSELSEQSDGGSSADCLTRAQGSDFRSESWKAAMRSMGIESLAGKSSLFVDVDHAMQGSIFEALISAQIYEEF